MNEEIANQYGLTYLAFLVVVPMAWGVLGRPPRQRNFSQVINLPMEENL